MTDQVQHEQRPPVAAPGRLATLAAAAGPAARGPAPVEEWHPPFCGDIDMRIAADGTWFYEGTRVNRRAMVELFARILRRDPTRFVLVTPVECVGIRVDDAPFVAVAMRRDADDLSFETNIGDVVRVDAAHPLRFREEDGGGVRPYVLVRGGLWARLSRSLAIDLLSDCETSDGGAGSAGIRVGALFFPLKATPPILPGTAAP